MFLRMMTLFAVILHMMSAQNRRDNILRHGELQSAVFTARTRASLSCERGDMVVRVNFTQQFWGLMYAYKSRDTPCKVRGTGAKQYELRIPLKGCGTWQESPRVFINNVTIRFHPALELEEDETKTIVCRYPPPLTPSPGSVQVVEPPVATTAFPVRARSARLSELEILIIICFLLFLSLLTLGIGIAYFCLRRKNIRIVRKGALASSSPPSQLTRLSSSNAAASSLLSSELALTVRIPRAVPYSVPARASQHEECTSNNSGEGTSTSSGDIPINRKVRPKILLSIPKANLRHHSQWPSTHRSATRDLEDQTVTTVLEADDEASDLMDPVAIKTESSRKTTAPVYAHVKKTRELDARVDEKGIVAKTDMPKVAVCEETTKDRTVITSVRHEVTETRIHPTQTHKQQVSDVSSVETQGPAVGENAKELLIRDLSDVYLTTTMETESKELKTKVTSDGYAKTDDWKVIIRHKSPAEQEQISTPRFDVTIRSRPPEKAVQTPNSVEALSAVLVAKTVRWMDADTVKRDSSSGESFQSSQSLRERSSSEVLEVAPTLPSRNPDGLTLERSTSEIMTCQEDHVRWIDKGGVPVTTSEFQTSFPLVTQGGFFTGS